MSDAQIRPDLRFYKLWFACGIALLAAVAVLSLIPIPAAGPEGSDKLAHIVLYAFLSAWFSMIVARLKSLWWVFCGLVLYGFLMEFLQGLTDYRSLEMADAIANSIGVALGLVCHFTPPRQWLIRIDHRLTAIW